MGVRIPPPLPYAWNEERVDGSHRADPGLLSRGPARVQASHVAEPRGARQLDDGRHRGDGRPRLLPGRGRHRDDEAGGKDPAMSSQDIATRPKQWFVVHTYSGFEEKVAQAIESRARIFNLSEHFGQVMVPTEKVVEVRNKQKRETEQKFFPGYVLVEMVLTDDTWHLVRSTPKVTGFVGSGTRPVALSEDQVEDIR